MASKQKNLIALALIALAMITVLGCGRGPSTLLRQGQLPINDFPLYLTDGSSGRIIKFNKDGTSSTFATGLSNPQGIATDRYNNVYVVDQGNSRVLKYSASGGSPSTLIDSLSSPFIVVVDSFGEIYVTQDGTKNVIRASDRKAMVTLSQAPTALTIGVSDTFITGSAGLGKVFWGLTTTGPSVSEPNVVNAAIDSDGLVYIAEGDNGSTLGVVKRFNQTTPGTGTTVVNAISNPLGIAVSPVGDVYVIETGGSGGVTFSRITIADHTGVARLFATGFLDPRFLTFTQY